MWVSLLLSRLVRSRGEWFNSMMWRTWKMPELSDTVHHIITYQRNLTCTVQKVWVRFFIHNALPLGRPLIGPKCILLHYNNPKHTARVKQNYLQKQEEQVVPQRTLIWTSWSQSGITCKDRSNWDMSKSTEELLQTFGKHANYHENCTSVERRTGAVAHTKYWFHLGFFCLLNKVNW